MKVLNPAIAGAIAAALTLVPTVGAQGAASTPPVALEATMSFSSELRGLALKGEPGRPYAVLAGTRRAALRLTDAVVIRVAPEVVLSLGRLDGLGSAFVPVVTHAAATAGDVVFAQALLWSSRPGASILPDQATDVVDIVLQTPETKLPATPIPADVRIRLADSTGLPDNGATLDCVDGAPPRFAAIVKVIAPTSGHALRIDAVRHNGTFTRVYATLERPHETETVLERLTPLDARALLGAWVGTVEVELRAVTRPAAKRTTAVGTR